MPSPRLVNLSSRAFVGDSASVEIAGFVISGPPGFTENVLIRGIGPALAQFGVTGVLQNPLLTVYDSTGNPIASNAGWSNNANVAQVTAAIQTTGAFALPAGSADSALLLNLPAGSYTAEISGQGGGVGVALAEVYEVTSGQPRLVNISTRAYVGAGSSAEIAGIVITGSKSTTVLVRAVGPTLGQFGVGNSLAQPTLQVVDGSGAVVASNTGWSANSNANQIAASSAAVGAFALPNGSADCALLVTLAPGTYTAVVTGIGGSSGVALVEAYQVP